MNISQVGKQNQILQGGAVVRRQPQESNPDTVDINSSVKVPEEGQHKKWLFMNYIAADCNLKEFQEANVTNQQLVGSDANTHIVDMIDVGHGTDPMTNTWSGCKTFYVTQGNDDSKITSPMIEDHGTNVDMSNPATLTKFIVDTMKKFPADNVALILNDHGGGFTGALADDSDGGFMSTPQLKQALADAEKVTGKKIDVLGFDACLMAEAEVAHELKGHANILLASEESEGGPGWTYNQMLEGSKEKPSIMGSGAVEQLQGALQQRINVSPEEFAKVVVKGNENHQNYISTFSATDLTKMDKVTAATNKLAEAILATNEKAAVKSSISKADHYGGGYKPYGDLHDLHNVADNVTKSVKDPALKGAAEEVKKALNEAIIANEANSMKYPNSKGLSIYAPTTAGNGLGYKYGDLSFAKETKWDEAMVSLGKTGPKEGEGDVRQPDKADVWPDGSARA